MSFFVSRTENVLARCKEYALIRRVTVWPRCTGDGTYPETEYIILNNAFEDVGDCFEENLVYAASYFKGMLEDKGIKAVEIADGFLDLYAEERKAHDEFLDNYKEEHEPVEHDERYYTPSATAGDYGPSNPWDAPGMCVSDFISGVILN